MPRFPRAADFGIAGFDGGGHHQCGVIGSKPAAVLGVMRMPYRFEIRPLACGKPVESGGLARPRSKTPIGARNLTARKAQVLGQSTHAPARRCGEMAVSRGGGWTRS